MNGKILVVLLCMSILSCKKITLDDVDYEIINKDEIGLDSLLSKNEIDLSEESASILLVHALEKEFDEGIDILLENGINPNITINGSSLADYLISRNDFDLLKKVIDYGYDPNTIVNNTESLLFWVSYNDHEDLIELLIDKGADVNFIDPIDKIPVFDMVIRLLPEEYHIPFFDADLDYSVKNHKGVSYLKSALSKGRINTVQLLIDNSELMREEIDRNDFWLDFIRYWTEGADRLGDYLVSEGFHIRNDLPLYQEAIKELNIDAVQWLLDSGISPYTKYNDEYLWYGYDAFNELDLTRKKIRSIEVGQDYEQSMRILNTIKSIISSQ